MKSWTIHVDGVAHEVTAATDPENGRTSIRIDGRMAARPMNAADEERDFNVGTVRYIMRKMPSGELDLDLAPPDFSPGAPAWTPPGKTLSAPIQRPPRSKRGLRIPFSVIATIVLLAMVRYAMDATAYLRVPWETYTAPDASFQIAVAGIPEQKSEAIHGLTTTQLRSRYKKHRYLLEWTNLPFEVQYEKEAEVLNGILDGFVRSEKATLLKRDWGHAARRDALVFIAQLPGSKEWSRGTMHGQLLAHRTRVYIMYAYVPQGEGLSFDVGEYLRSIKLP